MNAKGRLVRRPVVKETLESRATALGAPSKDPWLGMPEPCGHVFTKPLDLGSSGFQSRSFLSDYGSSASELLDH